MKQRAAMKLPYSLVDAAQAEDPASKARLKRTIGLRPTIEASGTHQKFATPIIRTLTCSESNRENH
jgi:hypothetical protein